MSAAQDEGTRTSLRWLRNFTVSFWSFFPLVWCLVQADLIDLHTEEVAWSTADILGKVGW